MLLASRRKPPRDTGGARGARATDKEGALRRIWRISWPVGLALLFGAPALADETTLNGAAAATGRYFGAALDPDDFDEKPYVKLATEQLGAVTPENQMKWGAVEPIRGEFNFRAADALVAFARARGQKIRGHNLVWHQQLPSWLVQDDFPPAAMRALMVDHIAREAGRYAGAIYAWDVVNEPFNDDGTWRATPFYDAMGADYIAIALKAARAADPNARLYINEYGAETAGPKNQALYDLVAALRRQGAAIDGVGFESHFVAGQAPTDLARQLERFAALGVDVAITELDLRVKLPATEAALAVQAADYRAVAAACRAVARCVGITTWGITDDHSWIPSFFSGQGAALPFDERYRPKPAAPALIAGLTDGAR